MATGNNSSNGHRQSRAAGVVPGVKNGWYTDTATLWPGQKFSLALEVRKNMNPLSLLFSFSFSHSLFLPIPFLFSNIYFIYLKNKKNFSNDAILFHEKSEFQDIAVFQSAQYGTCVQ